MYSTTVQLKTPRYDDIVVNDLFQWDEGGTLHRQMVLNAHNTTNRNSHAEMTYGTWRIENGKFIADQRWFELTVVNGVKKEVVVHSVCTNTKAP